MLILFRYRNSDNVKNARNGESRSGKVEHSYSAWLLNPERALTEPGGLPTEGTQTMFAALNANLIGFRKRSRHRSFSCHSG